MIKEALETLPAETDPTYEKEIRTLLNEIDREELENVQAIADDRDVDYLKYSAAEAAFMSEALQLDMDRKDFETQLIANRKRYIAGSPSLILSTNPAVADEVETCSIDDPTGTGMLVMSDGFARVLELPTIGQSWSRVIGLVHERGLTWLLGELRRCETEGSSFVSGHYKTSDDATAMLLRVGKRQA